MIQDKKTDKRLLPSFIGEPISDLNEKAHNNPFYNALQNITFAAAAFSGGYVSEAACFVAGTLVATACGLRAIETIIPGDMVLSANTETMETGYKPVVETYVRKVDKLVHLTVNGEEIITTVDHPFYVNGQGFVNAVDLCIGSELVDRNGNILKVEHIFRESLHDETCDVYNFKVDEWHTYFVGDNQALVHNSGYDNQFNVSETRKTHILEGEGPNDPGHGPNRGFGDSAFPDTWTDEYVIKAVEDVANNPNSIWRQSTGPGGGQNAPVTVGGPAPDAPLCTRGGRPVRFMVEGQNHGLNIRTIVEPSGEGIITGFPIKK